MPEMWEMQGGPLGREDPLEEDIATHASALAWRISWTESLAGYSPWGHKESEKQLSIHKEYSGCQFNTPDSMSGEGLTCVEEGYLIAGNEYPSVSTSEIANQFI